VRGGGAAERSADVEASEEDDEAEEAEGRFRWILILIQGGAEAVEGGV